MFHLQVLQILEKQAGEGKVEFHQFKVTSS